MESRMRLLAFDIIRIIAILMVLNQHLTANFLTIVIPGYDYISIGKLGVILFVFVSGAVLYFSKSEFHNLKDVLNFYYKRIVRLYPAMYLSFILAILLRPDIIDKQTTTSLIVQLSGTLIYFPDILAPNWGTLLNPMSYFIGFIMVFYLLYPLIVTLIKKSPYITMFVSIMISVTSTLYFNENINSSMPAPYLMFFVFGIFIAHLGLYIKTENNDRHIAFLSDLSFYVFLVNSIILSTEAAKAFVFIYALIPFYAYILMHVDIMVKREIDHVLSLFSIWFKINVYDKCTG